MKMKLKKEEWCVNKSLERLNFDTNLNIIFLIFPIKLIIYLKFLDFCNVEKTYTWNNVNIWYIQIFNRSFGLLFFHEKKKQVCQMRPKSKHWLVTSLDKNYEFKYMYTCIINNNYYFITSHLVFGHKILFNFSVTHIKIE